MPAFAYPAVAGTHLPTPEGWKAELRTYLPILILQLGYTCFSVHTTVFGVRRGEVGDRSVELLLAASQWRTSVVN